MRYLIKLQFTFISFFCLLLVLTNCKDKKDTEDQFSLHIRTTKARTPEDERLGFKLPPGFKIELFASEPDIGKPMNMSFDARGRMWVTQSNEYPFLDSTGVGPDRISILEDTDHDGKADKIIVFADSLNIPIGITPVPHGAIAYSIPNVYFLEDTDGDDKVDKRNIYLKGFQYKDTHGMINNFFRGLDGWIHADHGYSNESHVVGTDNAEPLTIISGNTFRFRLDGSGVEFTTTGRVNPFGYAMDEFGYMYSVDCHSSPIYQLIRGADYPHFGKTPTGIGFGPFMMRHEYGSTALAGLEYYTGNGFPEEFQQNFYLGDVVKCRVLRSSIKMEGTTPIPTWQPDFVISEDPWFRPVDVKQGPDGAIYIADFYNSIIGHYEVPLDHPARDRERGRIWRITYEGDDEKYQAKDWTKEELSGLLMGLNDPSQTVRMMVADQIVDRFGLDATKSILSLVSEQSVTDNQFIHGMWILFRLDALNEELIQKGLSSKSERIKVHTLRILFEMKDLSAGQRDLVRSMLEDNSPHVKREATMVLAKYPTNEQLRTFLDLLDKTPSEDTHFFYAIRQCLRDHLRDSKVMSYARSEPWNGQEFKTLADVARGVDNENAAKLMLTYLTKYNESEENVLTYSTHIARYLPSTQFDQLVNKLKEIAGSNLDLQYRIFKAIQLGVTQKGDVIKGEGARWAISLAETFIKDIPEDGYWKVTPLENSYRGNPWMYANFEKTDSFPEAKILISGPQNDRGLALTQLKSPTFLLPNQLSFYLFGRNNPPDEDGRMEDDREISNWVELFVEGENNPVYKATISQPDHRQEINWDLSSYKGKKGYLQLTDGSSKWYEYIGIGNLNAGGLELPSQSLSLIAERQIFACEVGETYQVVSLSPQMNRLLLSEAADILARQSAAEALLAISDEYLDEVEGVISNPSEPEFLKSGLLTTVIDQRTPKAYQIASGTLDSLSFSTQKKIVLALANDQQGIDAIFKAAGKLDVSPKILLEPRISELLNTHMSSAQKVVFESLTENLKPFSEEIQDLIDTRIDKYKSASVSVESGQKIFEQNCAICHQIKDQGGNIGPQLDGIGNWGLRALSEKILDPNRNISKAFINYSIELNDGKVRQGLLRRDEGQVRVFADVSGQEFTIPIGDIKSQRLVPFTLMPDNFSVVIPEKDYFNLMNYLLNQH